MVFPKFRVSSENTPNGDNSQAIFAFLLPLLFLWDGTEWKIQPKDV